MSFSPGTAIAERYSLVRCLGAGAMGEVWKAKDLKFKGIDRYVAIKFLKDDTRQEDAANRAAFLGMIEPELLAGSLTLDQVVTALQERLGADCPKDALRSHAETALGPGPYTVEKAAAFFDQIADNPKFNPNALKRGDLRNRFDVEASSLVKLRHTNIVTISDKGDHEGLPYLVMDFIEGRTLASVIQQKEQIGRIQKLKWMVELCDGLAHAHGRDLVHRDIKPANLIIDASSKSLKILDFGVVRQLQGGEGSTTGMIVGTCCYMSPEQTTDATLDGRSDIFSVGAVFYELLTFEKAFPEGKTIPELIGRIQKGTPVPVSSLVPDVEPEIEAIVNKALEKEPDQRYQDLSAMKLDIEPIVLRLLSNRTVVIGRTGRPVAPPTGIGKNPVSLLGRIKGYSRAHPVLVSVAVISLAGGGAAGWWRYRPVNPVNSETPLVASSLVPKGAEAPTPPAPASTMTAKPVASVEPVKREAEPPKPLPRKVPALVPAAPSSEQPRPADVTTPNTTTEAGSLPAIAGGGAEPTADTIAPEPQPVVAPPVASPPPPAPLLLEPAASLRREAIVVVNVKLILDRKGCPGVCATTFENVYRGGLLVGKLAEFVAFCDADCTFTVFLDGTRLGMIRPGAPRDLPVPVGPHSVRLEMFDGETTKSALRDFGISK